MEHLKMDCFNIHYHLSAYHFDVLTQDQKTSFESHIKKCTPCSRQIQRTQELIQLLAQSPFHKIDSAINDKYRFKLSDLRPKDLYRNLSRFWEKQSPLFRLTTETVLIAVIITTGIQLGPRLKKLYESQMDYQFKTLIIGEKDDTPALQRNKNDISATYDSEFSDVSDDEEDNMQVLATTSKAEVWRFNIKTDNPALLRSQIIKYLTKDLNIPKQSQQIAGVEAPGGIQFDLILESRYTAEIKTKLEELTQSNSNSDETYGQPFTWYKSRTKKPLPVDHSRIVIWISQI